MRWRIAVLLAVLSCLSLFALRSKYSEPSKTSPTVEVFGLVEACAPLLPGTQDVIVSPGDLIIDQSGKISNIRLLVNSSTGDIRVEEWYLVSGAGAGTLANFQEELARETNPLVATPLNELDTEAPGAWILALTASRAEPFRIELSGVEYDLDGQTYRIEDEFVFEQPCPNE